MPVSRSFYKDFRSNPTPRNVEIIEKVERRRKFVTKATARKIIFLHQLELFTDSECHCSASVPLFVASLFAERMKEAFIQYIFAVQLASKNSTTKDSLELEK